ncbi:hypothetical protein BGX21_006451, partial [Mortierella sp. AD011]
MRQRYPGLYNTNECQRYDDDEVETDHHLWSCVASMDDQKRRWETAVGNVAAAGRRAWLYARRKWSKDKEKAAKSGRDFTVRYPIFTKKERKE